MPHPLMQLAQVGKYKVLEKLGQGAMGEVFRAHDPVLGRDVAIKILSEKLLGDDMARQRFQREARSAAQLNHPNIITVHDFGEEQGMAYMAMELLEGTDLRELIEQHKVGGLEDRLVIMEQILEGLAFAHSRGVFHRDLKPGNIHVLPNGQVKIMDFGLARREQDAAATSVVMGTPYYMAPEQAEGDRPTARTDIFSLGALFYELLTGRRPFTGPTIAAVIFAVVHRDPEPLTAVAPELPAGLEPFVMRALAKDPADRYADGAEMLQALHTAAEGGQIPPTPNRAAVLSADDSPARTIGPPLAKRPDTPQELQAAISDIEIYLADRVPPLMVTDAVAIFTSASVEGAASEVWDWAGRQQALEPEVPLVDLLYHPLHKLAVVGELDLVPKEPLLVFLRSVGEELASALAPAEREQLRRALLHLGESDMVRTDKLKLAPRIAPLSEAATPGLKRLSLMERRLIGGMKATSATARAAFRRIASQAITMAATEAKDERELEGHLRRLKQAGVASGAGEVFRSLGQELAEWALPKDLAADTTAIGVAGEVRAMKQIVSLPADATEVARRFKHLVTAATEQFNAGNLGGAAQMFDLAAKLVAEKKVAAGYIEPIQKHGHEALDQGCLRQYLEKPDRHPLLRVVLSFFEHGFGCATMLDQLESEDRRDRRRLLLDLLLVHGPAARALARKRLLDSIRLTAPDFARRNWVYLLRLLPRASDEPVEHEVDAIASFVNPGKTPFLVKESLLYLGYTRHARAAQALVSLLRTWEEHVARGIDDLKQEGHATLDRLASALARQGGQRAWRALVDHALARRPELGATLARLAELGGYDLSPAPDVVTRLTDEIRSVMPRGVLGRLVSRKDLDLPALVAALAGTHTPEVEELLQEIVERYPSQEAGRAAARALQPPPAPAATGISGELDAFGLPLILQRLMDARASGTLNVMPRAGAGVPATIGFVQGRIAGARWAHRQGHEAFYQLFERPVPGTYAFDPNAVPTGSILGELATLVREGVHRARVLRHMTAVVPDDLPLEATGAPPGTVADEAEYELIVTLWQRACASVVPAKLEAELAADAFRIYRPLAQWLEEEALRVVTPAESAPAEAAAAQPASTSAAAEPAARQ
jgi:tRNA A-37 threonylcarbamoyl transferase component Bud32